MQARMNNPVLLVPKAMEALYALSATVKEAGVPYRTLELVHLRASQINGCSFCVDMHARELREAGETDPRLFGVAAWRESPHFTDAERAALALTEAVTRIADLSGDAVSDQLWEEVRRHYDERALAALIVDIGLINLWNRTNVPVKTVAGTHR
jgi:AhpD family alkylhydroperoxidase